ncbi:MAG: SAM-dependent DNA methyltransferase, partial [Deltaproteobacteria bacterium]|nr:SAM-dependent DNA methyltransferase [Deltaproteobacteria bacterium]
GPQAFESGAGGNINIMLISMSRGHPCNLEGNMFNEKNIKGFENFLGNSFDNLIYEIDVSEEKTASLKAELLKRADIRAASQKKQLENPDYIINLEKRSTTTLLNNYAKALQGISSGDMPHFSRYFWELPEISGDWVYWQSTTKNALHYGGKKSVLWFNDDFKLASDNQQAYIRGMKAWGTQGVVINQMGKLLSTIHTGAKHDTNCAIVLPHNVQDLPAIWCFCSSPFYNDTVRKIDRKVNVTNATLVKVPFEHAYWSKVAKEAYPHGLPEPYSNDPTQWIFHGHPSRTVLWDEQIKQTIFGPLRTDDTVLQVAMARLLGYRWPAELDDNLNLAKEQREIVKSCKSLETYSAKNGIVAIPPVRGEASASDRLLNLLAASYENTWSTATLNTLLKSVHFTDKTIESWLREKFFTQHCFLFAERPFIWHIWDGHKNGFAAFINYHKLDYKLLETLIYTYLGDWISRQKNDLNKNALEAQELLDAALSLQKKLEMILIGEAPYDIFVRWKTLEKQTKGWNPDLNDGVRLNIRPFLTVPDVSKYGAGILKDIPDINWKKDLGRDHVSSPWYQTFQGDRVNDHHLTLAEKTKSC